MIPDFKAEHGSVHLVRADGFCSLWLLLETVGDSLQKAYVEEILTLKGTWLDCFQLCLSMIRVTFFHSSIA